ALAGSGRAAVDEVLATLIGAARTEIEEALEAVPMHTAGAELPPVLVAHINAALAGYDALVDRSRAIKEQARGARSVLKSNFDQLDGCITDQKMGVPFPGVKPADPD